MNKISAQFFVRCFYHSTKKKPSCFQATVASVDSGDYYPLLNIMHIFNFTGFYLWSGYITFYSSINPVRRKFSLSSRIFLWTKMICRPFSVLWLNKLVPLHNRVSLLDVYRSFTEFYRNNICKTNVCSKQQYPSEL